MSTGCTRCVCACECVCCVCAFIHFSASMIAQLPLGLLRAFAMDRETPNPFRLLHQPFPRALGGKGHVALNSEVSFQRAAGSGLHFSLCMAEGTQVPTPAQECRSGTGHLPPSGLATIALVCPALTRPHRLLHVCGRQDNAPPSGRSPPWSLRAGRIWRRELAGSMRDGT